jgi:large subunit ribosomal protein L22
MEIVAKSKNIRMSSRKVGLVVELIRGKKVQEAIDILRFSPKAAAKPVLKTLKSAIANAKNNFSLKEDGLVVKSAVADPGPTLKRWKAGAKGRAKPILRRMSHIKITLESKGG